MPSPSRTNKDIQNRLKDFAKTRLALPPAQTASAEKGKPTRKSSNSTALAKRGPSVLAKVRSPKKNGAAAGAVPAKPRKTKPAGAAAGKGGGKGAAKPKTSAPAKKQQKAKATAPKGAAAQKAPAKAKREDAPKRKAAKTPKGAGSSAKATSSSAKSAWTFPKPQAVKQDFKPLFSGGPKEFFQALWERVLAAVEWVKLNWRTPQFFAGLGVVALYLVATVFFSSHFLPGTTVNGVKSSWASAPKVAASMDGAGESYSLAVTGDGVDVAFSGIDIGLAFDQEQFEQDVAGHMPGWLWPVRLLLPRNLQVTGGVHYDEEKVKVLVADALDEANKDTTPPQDAQISYDEGKGSFVVVPEQDGTQVSKKATYAKVCEAIGELQETVLLGEEELLKPAMKADSPKMTAAVERANELANLDIDLTIKGKVVHTIAPELLRSWIVVNEDYDVVGDLEAITDWTRGELSAEVDTVATARTYTRTSDGKRIEVYGGGTYGWNMDGSTLAVELSDHLAEASSESIEIPMLSTAEVYVHGKQDWGPRYIDVDLTEQYVIMFDKDSNILVESECVSGDIGENNETVTGVFMIEDKESPMTLIGLDNDMDGEPDYETDVDFWMPFYGGYGLHDALWREYFGGDAYQYNGSHGCINLPYYIAEQLYSLVEVGDVVVVHY